MVAQQPTRMTPPSKRAQHADLCHDDRWSTVNIDEAIRVWQLTTKETQQLRSLKDRLSDVDHFKNTPHEVVRYVRGPRGFAQAEELFRGMIDWRKNSQEDIDNMLDEYKPPRGLYEYAPSGLLQGVDHDGDPVYLERAGDMDGFGFCQRYDNDTMRNDVVWRRELTASGAWIEDYVKEHGHLPRTLTMVYDLKGLSSRHCKKGVGAFFKEAVSYTQDKYYGVSKRMIVIRAPTIFRMVWRVAKTFFRPEVVAKITFANSLDDLDKYMDKSILPPCVYPQGQGQAARGFPPNFEGGIIPDDFDETYEEEDVVSTNTCLSRDSGSFSSDDEGPIRSQSTRVFTKSLLKGSLALSDCGSQFLIKVTA